MQFVDLAAELGKLGTICAAVVELPKDRFSQLTDIMEVRTDVHRILRVVVDDDGVDFVLLYEKSSQFVCTSRIPNLELPTLLQFSWTTSRYVYVCVCMSYVCCMLYVLGELAGTSAHACSNRW